MTLGRSFLPVRRQLPLLSTAVASSPVPPFSTNTLSTLTRESRLKTPQMLCSGGKEQRGRTSIFNHAQKITDNELIAGIVTCKRGIQFLNRRVSPFGRRSRTPSIAWMISCSNGEAAGHRAGAELVSDRAALHINDGMVPVFALRSCRQSKQYTSPLPVSLLVQK